MICASWKPLVSTVSVCTVLCSGQNPNVHCVVARFQKKKFRPILRSCLQKIRALHLYGILQCKHGILQCNNNNNSGRNASFLTFPTFCPCSNFLSCRDMTVTNYAIYYTILLFSFNRESVLELPKNFHLTFGLWIS